MSTPLPMENIGPQAATMPAGRVIRAYLIEAKYGIFSMLRTPAFSITMLGLPVFLYLLIGVMIFGPRTAEDPKAAVFMFSGFLAFAVSGPGLFGFGVSLANERQYGILALKRAQPVPPGAYLLAKMIVAMTFSLIVMPVLILLAMWLGHLHLTAAQIANLVAVSLFGVLPFCAIGFLIGTLVSGSAAPGVVNLVFFPMLYLSGVFFPLPKALQTWALIWPSFYLNQLIWSAAGMESVFTPKICIALLTGLTVLCGGLAARRLARIG